ncbi:hypothetical protein ACWGDT_41130 [Streptomyces avermitilis]
MVDALSCPASSPNALAARKQQAVPTPRPGGPVPDPAAIRIRSQKATNGLLALAEAGRP